MIGRRAGAWVALGWLIPCGLVGAEPTPVLVQGVPGRFEVAAIDASAAHAVVARAEEAWRALEGPLALPAAFSSPVFVRLIPAAGAEAAGHETFRVNVEPGGVVSVWLRGGAVPESVLRRALVQGLLSRMAVAWHGVTVQPTVPRWLEHACAGWWQTRANTAQLDALKQRTAQMPPPPLAALLDWRRDGTERPEYSAAAVWLFTFLQAESGRDGEWAALLRRLLAGGDPQAAVATCYPGRFHGVQARELWWQTGWHHVRRVRVLPVLEVADSRAQLAALARFVFAAPEGEGDRMVSLPAVLARRGEPLVSAEVARRAIELRHLIPALHPFYRNAGLALAEVFGPEGRVAAKAAPLCADFEQDWRDAVEIDEATSAALDALERGAPPPGTAPKTG